MLFDLLISVTKKNGFIPEKLGRDIGHRGRESMVTAGHVVCRVRKRRQVNGGTYLASSFLFGSLWYPNPWNGATACPQTHRGCLLGEPKASPMELKLNSHNVHTFDKV